MHPYCSACFAVKVKNHLNDCKNIQKSFTAKRTHERGLIPILFTNIVEASLVLVICFFGSDIFSKILKNIHPLPKCNSTFLTYSGNL